MLPLDPAVRGVGGAVSGPADASILLLGAVTVEEDIVASAAFRLRVVGGIVPAYAGGSGTRSQRHRVRRRREGGRGLGAPGGSNYRCYGGARAVLV